MNKLNNEMDEAMVNTLQTMAIVIAIAGVLTIPLQFLFG